MLYSNNTLDIDFLVHGHGDKQLYSSGIYAREGLL